MTPLTALVVANALSMRMDVSRAEQRWAAARMRRRHLVHLDEAAAYDWRAEAAVEGFEYRFRGVPNWHDGALVDMLERHDRAGYWAALGGDLPEPPGE